MARTKKPCPGCGEVDPYRSAAEVCGDCKRKLKNEKHLREALEKEPDLLLLKFSSTYHWNPGFYGRYTVNSDVRIILARAFTDLVRCISGRVSLQAGVGHNEYLMERGVGSKLDHIWDGGPDSCVRVTAEQQIAVRRLFRAIDEALRSAYGEGVEHGENFLQQLAGGRTVARRLL